MSLKLSDAPALSRHAIRVGSVSFLNAKPLIYGLDDIQGLELTLDVPSKLLEGLLQARFDVALLPVIDYQRMSGLRLIPSGGIGCDGPTLTVRIFSPVPLPEVRTLACDTDSHTSVALAKILLSRHFDCHPRFVDLGARAQTSNTARLLIGDKVVCEEPAGFPHQIDLGEAWKQMTGLPFVFAAWMAREGVKIGTLASELERAKRTGLNRVDELIERYALPRGWPAGVARRYLTEFLQYDIGAPQIEAICLFHRLAHEHGILEQVPRALVVEG